LSLRYKRLWMHRKTGNGTNTIRPLEIPLKFLRDKMNS
jgi:hypothetical protein